MVERGDLDRLLDFASHCVSPWLWARIEWEGTVSEGHPDQVSDVRMLSRLRSGTSQGFCPHVVFIRSDCSSSVPTFCPPREHVKTTDYPEHRDDSKSQLGLVGNDCLSWHKEKSVGVKERMGGPRLLLGSNEEIYPQDRSGAFRRCTRVIFIPSQRGICHSFGSCGRRLFWCRI